jgi:uncharacterized protein (DUF1330 family)
MAKGFWLAQIDVTDATGFTAYVEANQIAFRKFGARYLVRGDRHEAVEGRCRKRLVVVEFPDYATALACYRSDEYQRALALRRGHADVDIVIVEGYGGAQP